MAGRSTAVALDVDQAMAVIEKGQRLAGHVPDMDDLDRVHRNLTGELMLEAARAELTDALERVVE